MVTGTELTAQEMKEQVLWAAQEMLRSGLVEGTAGNIGARLPDGNAVLTPSSLDYLEMTLDDLVVCDLDGNVLEGDALPHHREGAAPRRAPDARRHPRHDALPRQVRHDVRAHPPGHPGRHRGVRRLHRRRRGVRRLPDHRHRRARRGGGEAGRATAARCSWRTTGSSRSARTRSRSSTTRTSSSAPPRSCGARACSARSSRSRSR